MPYYTPIMWVGSKLRAIPTLKSLLPSDVGFLVSVFCGGCSFEIALAQAGVIVRAYDMIPYLVNYWNIQLSQPNILADRIELIHHEFEKPYFSRLDKILPSLTPLNQAAAFYALVRSSFYAIFPGGSYAKGHPNFKERVIKRVRDFRCPGLSVSMQDFRITLSIHHRDFLWLDPVYMKKSGRRLYGIKPTEFPHAELAALLRDHRGRFLLTYNDLPYVRNLYRDFHIIPVDGKWCFSAGRTKPSDEIIILNYDPPKEVVLGRRVT
ncbi:MAG: DNA adenine methylase [Desulfomonilaceae bacterium]